MITNTTGNLCHQFSFFYSIDTKYLVLKSRTPLFTKTNVTNRFFTTAMGVIHGVQILLSRLILLPFYSIPHPPPIFSLFLHESQKWIFLQRKIQKTRILEKTKKKQKIRMPVFYINMLMFIPVLCSLNLIFFTCQIQEFHLF